MTGVRQIEGVSTFPQFKGEILLCEDNEINQHAIQSLLTGLGFDVVLANNGQECVEIVSDRITNGKKPFDLICMDIYMPVMDGLEASDTLKRIGNKSPVIALSASTTPVDIETYHAHGMPDALNKPIVPEELYECLYQYFTPVCFVTKDEYARAKEEEKKQNRLFTGFVNRNQTTFADICNAIDSGDIKLAHRLAHTLRGLAGLMGEAALQDAARAVEILLAVGHADGITGEMTTLEHELSTVLDKLSPFLVKEKETLPEVADFDQAQAGVLFDRLEKLLQADNAMSLKLTEELKTIPKTQSLIEQIDDYEFETALETLSDLRKTLGV